jgi:uncharacterized membrane protein (UPF0127 family)
VSSQERLTRRRVLVSAAVAATSLAGCTGTSDTGDDDGSTDGGVGDSDRRNEDPADDPDETDETDDPDRTDNPDETADDTDGESDCAGATVHESYEERAVTVSTPDGEQLGSVTAAVADTSDTRRTGLSETACLPPGRGMLFVYDSPDSRNFWMIDMSFGIDIVYLDPDGVITSIHHAEAPAADESGTEEKHQYPGEGQYVLEVNKGWTTERGVEAGDIVEFDR